MEERKGHFPLEWDNFKVCRNGGLRRTTWCDADRAAATRLKNVVIRLEFKLQTNQQTLCTGKLNYIYVVPRESYLGAT
jgi:hypothetical protein